MAYIALRAIIIYLRYFHFANLTSFLINLLELSSNVACFSRISTIYLQYLILHLLC